MPLMRASKRDRFRSSTFSEGVAGPSGARWTTSACAILTSCATCPPHTCVSMLAATGPASWDNERSPGSLTLCALSNVKGVDRSYVQDLADSGLAVHTGKELGCSRVTPGRLEQILERTCKL